MDREFYRKCIKEEVFEPYRIAKNKKKLNLFDKIWCKYISTANANVLIRKMHYLYSRSGITMLTGSAIIGNLYIADNVSVGAWGSGD